MYWRLAASWLSAPSVRHWRRMSDERRGCATYSCGTYSARLNDAAGDCSVHAPKRTQHWSAANVMHCASVAGNVAEHDRVEALAELVVQRGELGGAAVGGALQRRRGRRRVARRLGRRGGILGEEVLLLELQVALGRVDVLLGERERVAQPTRAASVAVLQLEAVLVWVVAAELGGERDGELLHRERAVDDKGLDRVPGRQKARCGAASFSA
jgi:hypothetical protein